MKHYLLCIFLLFGVLQNYLHGQESDNYDLWRAAVERHIQNGTFQSFHGDDELFEGLDLLEKSGDVCPEVNYGYGTAGWGPNSNIAGKNADPSCTIKNNLRACNGGKYRVALRNIIFECPNWNGDNYLESGSGFRKLSDADITARFARLNTVLANANIELVEVERVRVSNCDMYDFYFNNWGKDPRTTFSDGVNDETQLESYEKANTINIFWVGGFNANHGCCGPLGFIDKLPTSRDYGVMRYNVTLNKSSLEHDMGHYFGVYHPHWDLAAHENIKTGYPDGALNNSDCLTHGDGICDTWPGAALEYKCSESCQRGTNELCYQNSDCTFNMANYRCVNGHELVISPDQGTRIGTYTSTVLSNNYATYNSDDCRQTFTPCQYYKMNTIARTCRNHVCITDPFQYFYNTSDFQKEIGSNEPIPSFTAGKPYVAFNGTTYNVDCFDWFLNENDRTEQAVVKGTSSFNPTNYINGPGTYTFYMAEANTLSQTPCKIPVKLTIKSGGSTGGGGGGSTGCTEPKPGKTQGSTIFTLANGTTALPLTTSGATLASGEVVGWWITKDTPINNTVNSQSGLDAKLNGAQYNPTNDGSAFSGSPNVVFSSSAISGGLIVNCASLTANTDYYATPFVLKPTSSTSNGGGSCNGTFTYTSTKVSKSPAKVAIMKRNSLACASNTAPTYTLTVQVSGYTGTSTNFRLQIVPEKSKTNLKLLTSGGNGTYTFTQQDLNGYDPNPQGLRVLVYEQNGNGANNVTLNVSLSIRYGGSSSSTTLSAIYSSCLFGAPVSFRCNSSNSQEGLESRSNVTKSGIVSVFPSPTEGNYINLKYESVQTGKITIEILDINGKSMHQKTYSVVQGENVLMIELGQTLSGIHLLKVKQDNLTELRRFTVVK